MSAKKQLLFIMNDLHSGGAQKALVSLLQGIDFNLYDVDLQLFKKEGIFLGQVPKSVNILEVPDAFSYFDGPLPKSLSKSFFNGKFHIFINRLRAVPILKSQQNAAVREQQLWRFLSPVLKKSSKKYDAAIGFLEKTPNNFCIEKTTASKKILWIHTNYSNMGMDARLDKKIFSQANAIATISQECADDLLLHFPQLPEKIKVIPNLVSAKNILEMANQPIAEGLDFHNSILTVGRLSHEKGIDLALESCKLLKKKNLDFRWFFIGDGVQKNELEQKTITCGLQDHVVFLGEKANPYPYVKAATIYAQTSRFEGKSIAVDEAKILQKPIVLTDFSTAASQIDHLKNGYIATMDPRDIADGIALLLADAELRNAFEAQLGSEKQDTADGIESFYQLLAT